MNTTDLFIKVILCLIFSMIIINLFKWVTQKHSLVTVETEDGFENLVRNMPDKNEAAKVMTEIKKRLKKLMKYVKDKEANDEHIDRVYRNLDIDAMKETDMNDEGTSYSVNKGQELSICMRDKDDPNHKLHDINTLMFVVIHETAHLMSKSYGHNQEFFDNFKYLLQRAEECGVYRPVDYSQLNQEYCGMEITDNPMY